MQQAGREAHSIAAGPETQQGCPAGSLCVPVLQFCLLPALPQRLLSTSTGLSSFHRAPERIQGLCRGVYPLPPPLSPIKQTSAPNLQLVL